MMMVPEQLQVLWKLICTCVRAHASTSAKAFPAEAATVEAVVFIYVFPQSECVRVELMHGRNHAAATCSAHERGKNQPG